MYWVGSFYRPIGTQFIIWSLPCRPHLLPWTFPGTHFRMGLPEKHKWIKKKRSLLLWGLEWKTHRPTNKGDSHCSSEAPWYNSHTGKLRSRSGVVSSKLYYRPGDMTWSWLQCHIRQELGRKKQNKSQPRLDWAFGNPSWRSDGGRRDGGRRDNDRIPHQVHIGLYKYGC